MGLCLKRSKLFTKQLDLNKSKPITNWPGRNSGAFDAFSIKCSKREKSTVKKSQCQKSCSNTPDCTVYIYEVWHPPTVPSPWNWPQTHQHHRCQPWHAGDKISNEQRTGLWWVWSNLQDVVLEKKMWLVIFYTQKNVLLLHFLHLMCWHEEKHVTSFCVQSKLDQETHWENESENRKTLIVSGLYQGAWSVALAIRLGSLAWWNSRDADSFVSTDFRNVGTMTLQLCWNVGEWCQGFAGLPKLEASDHSSVSFKGLPGHSLCTSQCEKLHSTKTVCLDKLGFFLCTELSFLQIGWCGIHWIHHNQFLRHKRHCEMLTLWAHHVSNKLG